MSIERRSSELGHQQTNLTKRLSLFDDDESAAPLVVEIEALSRQRQLLARERDELVMQREGWETAQQRLEDFEYWCRVQAANLGTLTYEQKRLALHALNSSVRVWSTEHDPRYAITLELEGLVPGQALNGLHPASDGDHDLAHVDGYSSRGCARLVALRADRL
ncbi:MAG: hypothetical protein M3R06_03040 [Chloroflexota bacterium]|nr:hypothetical protein [Chloroflexota bacterium]